MARTKRLVIWDQEAAWDLKDIVYTIASDRPMTAEKWADKILKKARSLSLNPERCRRVPELEGSGFSDSRELILSPYRLFFEVKEREILIFALLDGRRDLQELLFQRLLRRN